MQVIAASGAEVLDFASTVESTIREQGNPPVMPMGAAVGKTIAERALAKGDYHRRAFDRHLGSNIMVA